MANEKTESKLDLLKKFARRVTTEETIEAGLEVLEATGLPLEEVEHLARRVGLELEDVAYTLGGSHSGRQVHQPIQLQADVVRLVTEMHDVVVKRQASRLSVLSQTERDLYDAADEQVPFKACDLCHRSRLHDLNSTTKQCLSNLVKLGLLTKASGRRGYLRIPARS